MSVTLETTLRSYQKSFVNLTPFDLNDENVITLDFSKKNKKLLEVDFSDEFSFCNYVDETLASRQSIAGIGGYGEHRAVYERSAVFGGEEPRSIHLGIDIWAKAGTPIFAPLEGRVHSYKINGDSGDYGPTIILEHSLDGYIFYTLYGHLSTASLDTLSEGSIISKGQKLATLGEYFENVHWPPHLHFQLIKNLQGKEGDYPGVAAPSTSNDYLSNCPDPNLILGVRKLQH